MPKHKRHPRAARDKHAFAAPPGKQHYGWAPDLPDARDHLYKPPRLAAMPPKVSLRDKFPQVYRQGQIKSCAANAIAAAIQFERANQRLPLCELTPSRLFIYYNARAIEGTVESNAPCQIRNAIKGVAAHGACFEGQAAGQWPYVIARFKQKPHAACFTAGKKDRPLHYSRLAVDLGQIRACLASGYPFVFGFMAYESIESRAVSKTGVIPMPKAQERALGGHVVLAVGYDDEARRILIRNSWGPKWGDGGYGSMPYGYVADLRFSHDFWAIQLMSASDGG
jgi:C1A family cysteine protease